MRVLFDGFVTHENFGIFSAVPPQRYVIFDQGVEGICGFKEYTEAFSAKGTEYVEIGLFIKLVFEGFPVPYFILNLDKDYVELVEDEFLVLMSERSGGHGFLPVTKDFIYKSIDRLESFLSKSKGSLKSESFSTILNTNILSEIIRKYTISGVNFNLENRDFIQSLVDNRLKGAELDVPGIKKFIKNNLKDTKSSIGSSKIREGLSRDELHSLLLTLRGIKNGEKESRNTREYKKKTSTSLKEASYGS